MMSETIDPTTPQPAPDPSAPQPPPWPTPMPPGDQPAGIPFDVPPTTEEDEEE